MHNMFTTGLLATLLAAGQLATAHMEMSFPPPLRSKFNPNAANIDYSMTAPLSASGSDYPCKGYQADLGTAAGKSTATFAPGSTHNFTIVGGAAHGGGSCQASLSYDGGKTFTVIQSIIGGCPLQSNYDFTVPADAKAGDALFAWTWFNHLGNREMYMNCAAITIGGASAKRELTERDTAFSARPSIFLANIGNGCGTVDSTDVVFPNPGPDVVNAATVPAPPTGNCAGSSSGGSGSGSGSGAGSSTPSAPAAAPSAVSSSAAPATPFSTPGGVFLTVPTGSPTASAVVQPTTTAEAQTSSAAPAETSAAVNTSLVVIPVPTTLQTATKTTPASVPAGTGTGTGSSGEFAAGTACTDEGAWNCIAGTAFQRCASGAWSAVINMAAGTKCTSGVSDSFAMTAGRRSVRNLRARRSYSFGA
ncbi:hypothetical protein B0T22DRAFT_250291 [Podospora appendiculata]|uniref:Glycoside Hydrolase Family 61 n=1 Tax=Podospora appendiculata TaxID=314037 RepID=A0AAE0X2J6_9PEZI|nr:hypothetical protein B0T22DRAFT_195966 [Podospora appendiculata]KAK3683526.1 hypothetical protein B0T22DRAFT_250291 [Podospora appendiculata]